MSYSWCTCWSSCCWMWLRGSLFGFWGHLSCPSSSAQCCSARFRPGSRLTAAWCWSSVPLCETTCNFTLWLITRRGPLAVIHMKAQHLAFRQSHAHQLHPFFAALRKNLSMELEERKKKYMPYHQHKYFFLIWPLPCSLSPSSGVFSILWSSKTRGTGRGWSPSAPPVPRSCVMLGLRVAWAFSSWPGSGKGDWFVWWHRWTTSCVHWSRREHFTCELASKNNDHDVNLWNMSEKAKTGLLKVTIKVIWLCFNIFCHMISLLIFFFLLL